MTAEAIVDAVRQSTASHVVLTGGEPMIVAQLPTVCRAIRELGIHITIETAGTKYQELDCDLMSISPKLQNSTPTVAHAGDWSRRHEQTRYQPDVVRRLMQQYDYQLKFVVDFHEDLLEIDRYLEGFDKVDAGRVWLMPQGVDVAELSKREEWMRPLCESRGFHLCPRMQIHWYGNRRGT